ncbi:hypothetical protein LF1_00270 [Rubripirellula obstinata]|uniref:Uncharacterized protein n=1 Tax=Rubripirellula obstinata TaxID=406547 RepID=A0A5B1CD52_9BACT|nr:hypothetical protein LF1_00270 [Rubripirellula obstinata]
MGQPLWLSLLNVSVMPTAIGVLAMLYSRDWLGWPTWLVIPLFPFFWLLGFCIWTLAVGGLLALRPPLAGPVHSHPPCPTCSHPLATQFARQCLHCGADWHGPELQDSTDNHDMHRSGGG